MQHRAEGAAARSLVPALTAVLVSLVTAGSVVVGTGALVDPARADDGGLRVEGAPMTFEGLAPGHSRSASLDVHNDSPYAARIVLLVTDVTDEENSCERPERRQAGEECDADGGELRDWLRVTLTGESPLWSGAFDDLLDGVTLDDALAPGESLPLRFRIELPMEAGNDTMTDSVAFTSRFVGTSVAGGESVVAGPKVTTNASGPGRVGTDDPGLGGEVLAAAQSGPRVALPMTGGTISLWLLLLDVFLLTAGAGLVRAAYVMRSGANSDEIA